LNAKYFYQDPEDDLILITNDQDLEEAYECLEEGKVLRLYVANGAEQAKKSILEMSQKQEEMVCELPIPQKIADEIKSKKQFPEKEEEEVDAFKSAILMESI
jgi:hypothetical protein